ncbi:MAG: hypothetical protein IT168_33035 [Bryobacterales bacterium]|nr:hypothetical protein [Bryobacterales bacterium]
MSVATIDKTPAQRPAKFSRGRKKIVAILPRGEAVRNFVFGNALDLVAEEAEVHLISCIPDESTREMMAARYDSLTEIKLIQERYPVRLLREVLDMAHGRWLWSWAAQDRWRLRDFDSQVSASETLKRLGKKILCYPFAHRPGLRALGAAERFASRVLRNTGEYIDYMRKLQPSLVFNASHVHCNPAVQPVQAAQWLGCPSATFIFSWDNLTSQGRIMLPYDYFLTWSEDMRSQLLDIYRHISADRVFVTGTPQFDFHFQPKYYWSREEFCATVGADPKRPIILYSSGMVNYMPHEMKIVEGIADMLKGMTALGSPQLLVRVYPKDRTNRFEELRNRRPDILFQRVNWDQTWLTPLPDDVLLLTNTFVHVDAGINISSTMSLELCMFDRPVINVGYNPPGVDISPVKFSDYYKFDHYRPVAESGAINVVYDINDMPGALEEALRNPSARRQQRHDLIRQMFGATLDGKSGQRVAEKLLTLAAVRKS